MSRFFTSRLRRDEAAAALIAVAAVGVGAVVWARRTADPDCCRMKAAPKLDAPILHDPQLAAGELTNHLHYFVQGNDAPPGRAELRLVVNAGAVLEAPDQRGLAHAVEHMVFRGTQRFPGHAVDDYFESIGMRSGSDVNASTSEDETIYRVTVPTSRAGAVDTALAILADMARDATFDRIEARQEAGVVMSEWRSRSDARQRLTDQRNALLFAGSQYADHTTIGDTAVLREFDVHAMRRFYDDWYRPDLMAVVAVGDFDARHVESTIRKEFGTMRAPDSPRKHPTFAVPISQGTRASVLRDAEATASRVSLLRPKAPVAQRRLSEYRDALIDDLWSGIMSDRLDDAAEQAGSPILSGDASTNSFTRTLDADIVGAGAVENREPEALKLLSAEVARLAKYGVPPAELDRRKAMLLRERRNTESWSDNSAVLAVGYADEFLTGDVHVGRALAYTLARDLLPTINAPDITARARQVTVDSGALLFVTRRAAAREIAAPSELLAIARNAANDVTPPAPDSIDAVPLVRTRPTPPPGAIAKERPVGDVRVFDWTLVNGMRVILKPARLAADQIDLRMFGPGGASLATDDEYPSAFSSDGVLESVGVGPLSGRRLDRRLSSTTVDLTPSVSDAGIFLQGSAAPRDLDLVFQLLYLYFTDVRSDTVAFRRYQDRMVTYARGRAADPDATFDDSAAAIAGHHGPRALTNGSRFASSVTLAKALSFWRARTANASGFTLVMTGDFALDRIRPLVGAYLASLPAGVAERPRDVGAGLEHGTTRRQFAAGQGPKARTQIVMSGLYDGTSETNDNLATVADLTERALSSRLRERLGGTYDVRANASFILTPPLRYTITIDFEASPERIDSLSAAALKEMERLRTAGPSENELQRVREAKVRDLDGQLERNTYWLSELAWHARMGWPLGAISRHQDDGKLLTMATVRKACASYLHTDDYVQVTMIPVSTATQSAGGAETKRLHNGKHDE